MPESAPTPEPGRPAARGRGRTPDPEGEGLPQSPDPPTVRSTSTGSASGGSSARRVGAGRPGVPPLPIPGDRVDVFELEESIGAGGMGAVFRAIDTKLDRQVALKILPPDQAVDPEVVRRYHQEGRAAARLDHENIARVYTIGDDGTYHYIAFEYIEGTTIRQRVELAGPLAVGDAINFTLQIANALVHAAARGVVHRDIKPSNIIVTPQGRAKLVDMGLARRFERGEDTGLTQSGMTLGTFDYISPEQARDPRDVDVRGDLYSLGCTLFHMLSGRPPFPEGTVLQKLLQHQEEAPPEIRALNPAVPGDLAAILVKLMAKDRDRRYQTPEQLVRDLLAVAGPLGLRSINPEGLVWMAPSPTPGWVRHVVWGVPGLAFLLILAYLAWSGDGPAVPGPVAEAPAPAPAAPKPAGGSSPGPSRPAPAEPAAPREFAVDSRDDLLRILAEAPPRSTILLADPGPYDLRGAKSRRLAGLDLTIRAEVGVRPALRLPRDPAAADGPGPAALLDLVGGRVTIDGLEFLVEGGEAASAIRAEDAEVVIRRCRFRRPGASPPRSRPSAIQVRSSGRAGGPLADRPAATLTVDASEFDGGQAGVIAAGPVELSIRDCTFGPAPADSAAVWCDNPEGGLVPVEVRLAHLSVLAGAGPVFRFAGTAPRVRVASSAFAPPSAASPPATLVAIDSPDRLDWRGVDNLYGRVGVYLRPGGLRATIRAFEAWADDPSALREAGSAPVDATPWEDRDPLGALVAAGPERARAFRLALAHSMPPRVGARQGPTGPLPAPAILPDSAPAIAALPVAPGPPERRARAEPPRTREVAAGPPVVAPGPARPKGGDPADEMLAMPLELPGRAGLFDEVPGAPAAEFQPMPMPVDPERSPPPQPASAAVAAPARTEIAPPPGPMAEPGVIRTAEEFARALAGPAPGARTLVIAADADWALPACRPQGPASWVIRAERGATRPRIRFRPDPSAPLTADSWAAWLTVPPGGLRLEGVDLVLAAVAAPRPPARRWAAFALPPGTADLTLIDCTVTIEGDALRSAVVALPPAEDRAPPADPSPPAARVRIQDGLIRVGDDLVDVAPGRAVDLDVDNAAIATGGALAHGHGLPPGRAAGPIKLALRRVTARLAGGLIQLQSTPQGPALPVADVSARETILATVDPDAPLFRVDGQGDVDLLRDRIQWEGRSVAYHQINVYRRDQTTQPGALPTRFDRDFWGLAVGRREEFPLHGDLKFLNEWGPDRPAWSLRPDDVRLRQGSPAVGVGADLRNVPSPPIGAP